jgi:hypothetical protein
MHAFGFDEKYLAKIPALRASRGPPRRWIRYRVTNHLANGKLYKR